MKGLSSVELAKLIYETAVAEGAIRSIAGWDARSGHESYDGSIWRTGTSGLRPEEKAKWHRVAIRIRSAME